MFRPYSLKSLTAWTVGSLAGNQAYYKAKSQNAGLRVSKAKNPEYVTKLHKKLLNISKEVVILSENFSLANATPGKLNTTPLLKIIAYSQWLDSHSNYIKTEIRTALERATSDGYIYVPDTITNLCETTDNLVEEMNSKREEIWRQLREMFKRDPSKDKIFEACNRILADMQVDDGNWKMKTYKGDTLSIVGPAAKS